MKSPLHWLSLAFTMMFSVIGFSQTTLYVSTTGTDASNNCQTSGSPCATIEHAVTQITAGDTIKVAPGNYSLTATLNLIESVVVTALNPTNKPVLTTSASNFIYVNSDDVTISNLILEMGLTATSGLKGIVADNSFDNLVISNNEINSTNPLTGTPGSNMVWGAFAISLTSTVGDVQTVEITDNIVSASATSNIFGRGIYLGNGGAGLPAPGGLISGNTVASYYTIQAAMFSDDVEISENNLSGIMMVNTPASGVSVDVIDNTFSGDNQMTSDHLYALVELRSIEDANVSLTNNTFENYSRVAFLSEASKNVILQGNTFNPATTATNFISVMVNTKIMTTGVQGNTYADAIEILGNTFNAGVTSTGTAIVFADHFGANTPAFGNVVIGGVSAAQKNTFNTNLANYIVLDNQAGASDTYPLWTGYQVTTMKPVTQEFTALAIHNNYNLVDFVAIEGKNIDVSDDATVGKIRIKSTGTTRYVATTGSNVSNDCTLAGSPCATVAHALSVAEPQNTIEIAPGTYPQTTTLNLNIEGLTVKAGTPSTKPVLTTNQPTLVDVNANKVTIEGIRLELGLTDVSGKYGVESTSKVFNNLKLTNNEILSSSPASALGMVWDSYAVRLYSTALDTVEITNNIVATTGTLNNTFGRAIALGSGSFDGASATITGNEVTGFYTLQIIRSTGDVTISDNVLTGITMLNSPLANTTIDFNNNTLDALNANLADNLYAILDIRAIELGAVEVSENTFANFTNIGLLSMASKNVTVKDNVFNPNTTADEFVSVMVNTKLMTNGVQGNTNLNEIELVGNTFNAGAANGGTAIVFADHYGVTAPAFGTVTIGGATTSLKNTFDTDLGNYIVMDDKTGASNTQPLWAAYAVTTMKPMTQDIEALFVNNVYNLPVTDEVELKNIDSVDNNILGKVILAYSFLGLHEVSVLEAKLYPNPVQNNLTIELMDKSTSSEISIVDMVGNTVCVNTITGVETIDVSKLQAGVYLVQMSNGGSKTSTRFVKQ